MQISLMAYSLAVSLLLVLSFAFGSGGGGSGSGSGSQPDQTCIAPLETLFDCLPYAQGKAALPTPTCCTNIDKVFNSQKKCLCELMAASFQGGISGLPPFNSTLALHMPSACNVPADPSKCPGLLGIPASSPEAKEFTSAALQPNGTSGPNSNTTASSSSTSTTLSVKNNAACFPSTSAINMMKSLLLLICYIHFV